MRVKVTRTTTKKGTAGPRKTFVSTALSPREATILKTGSLFSSSGTLDRTQEETLRGNLESSAAKQLWDKLVPKSSKS